MRALVLSGGGGRGAYEFGVYKALAEAGLEFDVLSGTSVGAITCAGIAAGMTVDEMESMWLDLGTLRVIRPRMDVWNFPKWRHFGDTRGLSRFLEERIDFDAIHTSDKELRVAATDVNSGAMRIFRNREVTLDTLLASSAMPLIFPLVEIHGRQYWDGGIGANTPLKPAIDAGATDLYSILLSPVGAHDLPPPKHLWDTISRLVDLVMLGTLKEDIQIATMVNGMIDRGEVTAPGWRHLDLHVIAPEHGLGLTAFFNFGRHKARELIGWGHHDGRRFLREKGPGGTEYTGQKTETDTPPAATPPHGMRR